jgi:DNA polymerase elongation subunit (family B)
MDLSNVLSNDLSFQIIDWYTENFNSTFSASVDDDDEPIETNEDEDDDEESNDNNSEYYDSDDSEGNWRKSKKLFKKDEPKFKILIFGKDQFERTYSLLVNGFTPYFYIKVPDFFDDSHVSYLKAYIKEKLYESEQKCFIRCSIWTRSIFRGFNETPGKFIRLVFSNTNVAKKVQGFFQSKDFDPKTNTTKRGPGRVLIPEISKLPIVYDLYDSMIDPLIRFIHHRNLKPVGWISVKQEKFSMREDYPSWCDYDLQTEWTDIEYNDRIDNVPIKVLTYDIETNSSHGDMSIPKKDYLKLARQIVEEYERLQKNHDKYSEILSNKITMVEMFLRNAYSKAPNENNISYVFTKGEKKPKVSVVKAIAEKIASLMNLDSSKKSLEYGKDKSNLTTEINSILNENLPAVEGDNVIQIGCSFIKFGAKIPYRNILLVLGTCDPIDRAEVITFESEAEMLLEFTNLIQQENPDIIAGFNTEGFDTPYLFKRADELGILYRFTQLSKIKDHTCEMKEKQVKGLAGQLVKVEFADMPGRIQMDIYKLFRKDEQLESYKLDDISYKFISGGIKKLQYNETENTTKVMTKDIKGLNMGNYIVFTETAGYRETKYKGGEKFMIKELNFDEGYFIVDGEIDIDLTNEKCKVEWHLGKDDVKANDIFRLNKGTSADRALIAKYCLMDVILTTELLLKKQYIANNIGMANVCLIPLAWVIHRGQGVKILSLIASVLRKKNYVLPQLYKDGMKKEKYEGAVVLKPHPGIYLNDPISVLDFGSLYPSSMIEVNISHETKCINPEHLGPAGKEYLENKGYDVEDVEYDIFKTTFTPAGQIKEKIPIGKKNVRFIQYRDGRKGILPEILMYLIKNRKLTRDKIEYKTVETKDGNKVMGIVKEIDADTIEVVFERKTKYQIKKEDIVTIVDSYSEFEQRVFDGQQLAYKITANSLYGQMGAKTSDVYDVEIAASTTATGRARLMIAKAYVENPENFPQVLDNGETIYLRNKVIYGDTDSVFIKYQCLGGDGQPLTGKEALKRSIELGQKSEHDMKAYLREPQVCEYEKTFWPFILFTKKRYIGDKYENDTEKHKLTSMGIVLKRRDNAPIVKIIYGGIIDIIMNKHDIQAAMDFLRKSLRNLIDGKFPMDYLIISKSLNSFYKTPDRIAHRVLADRIGERDPGNRPQVGDRIPYVYFEVKEKKGEKLLSGDKIETPEYMIANKLKPDYEYYITGQIMNPVSQIFALVIEDYKELGGRNIDFEKVFNDYVKVGKGEEFAIKKTLENKQKVVSKSPLFADILRVIENKKSGMRDITSFLKKK